MILDLFFLGWLIVAGLLGFRDGAVRKIVSLITTIGSLILGQMYMRDVGQFLVENAGADPVDAAQNGFLLVVFGTALLQALAYRLAAGAYKIGGIADRITGSVLGVGHGVLFLSTLLFIGAMSGSPSKALRKDSRLYGGIVNVAPQLLDLAATAGPETLERFKEMTTPDGARKDPRTQNPAGASRRPANPDSLRSNIRR